MAEQITMCPYYDILCTYYKESGTFLILTCEEDNHAM